MNLNLCFFCNSIVYPGHGSLFVKNNFDALWFCRSKCKKLFSQKKNPVTVRWTFSNRKRRGLVLKNEFLNIKKNAKYLPVFNKYNKYLISYVLYQKSRKDKIEFNRALDYKFKRNTKN